MKKLLTILLSLLLVSCLVACSSNETSEDTTTDDETTTETTETADLSEFVGSYQDSYSQRAEMDVTLNDDGTLNMLVHWSSSAFEYTQWTMNATLNGDKLEYTDCTKSNFNEEVETVEYTDGTGYFEVSAFDLLWTGAGDESCVDCHFVLEGTIDQVSFSDCLNAIYNIQPGTAGSSLKAEEAADTVRTFIEVSTTTESDYTNMTTAYLENNDVDAATMLECLNALNDGGYLSDVANFTVFYNGVAAALN